MQKLINSKVICGNEIEPREIEWLWYPYIPIGKLTTIQGDPGEGKSTFAINLAAQMTRGESFPFSDTEIEPMNVIYQNTEDDLDDTVIPRFLKAGGDPDRIFFIDESREPLVFGDVERIDAAIKETNAKVIIFDPVVSYIGEKVSMNNANEVRAQLNKLIRIAKENHCAIIVVEHMSKSGDKKSLYRAVGSIDFVAAARSCLVIATYKEEKSKAMAVSKCNLAEKGAAVQFNIIDGKIEWVDLIELTADQLLRSTSSSAGEDSETKYEVAQKILRDFLSDGPKYYQDVMAIMDELGISHRTADEAKKALGVKSEKRGKTWKWMLS